MKFFQRSILALVLAMAAHPALAQNGTKSGEWPSFGGDVGNTRYSPLDQINPSNVKDLQIAWRWKAENFGPRTDFNWEVTPLMIGDKLYFTAGSRRDVIAADAATGETLWMYRIDEGERGDRAVRTQNRGLAYWSDGKDDNRVILITPGFQLVCLDAKTGRPIPSFAKEGIFDLTQGLDRDVVKPGQIGSSSPAVIVRDVIVVGAALAAGTAPPSKENVPGYIRGFDVHTGKLLWTFKTVPHAGEEGVETWENDSWKYTGNTAAWAPLSGDEQLGYVYIPVESPTGDFYGGTRLGNNLFGDSLVCLDAKTGKRIWYFQIIHHDIWDYEPSSPPLLADVTIAGKPRKIVALVTKFCYTYVFDRVTGEPIWPIVETPVPQSTVPGERTSPTQPIPTKPLPFDRVGVTYDQLIDFTPELHQQAIEIVNKYKFGPVFMPPSVRDADGKIGTLILPHHTGGANWPGGVLDPETGIMYVSSLSNTDVLAVALADPKRSDMGYVGALSPRPTTAPATATGPATTAATSTAPAPSLPVVYSAGGEGGPARPNIGPQGLPLVKPPWGRITAINLNTGDHVWMVPNGTVPDAIKNNPALKGIDLSKAGNPERAHMMITKSLLIAVDGAGLFNAGPGGGGNILHALDKKTGETLFEMTLPAGSSGLPMTYTVNDQQYIVVATGGRGVPAELIALTVP